MSDYSAVAARALATITRKGAPVVFLADTWRGGSIAADVTGQAVEIEGDPEVLQALGLLTVRSVTLLVAASGLGLTVLPGQKFTWAGTTLTVKASEPVAPNGTPIVWTVVGVAGSA